MASPSRNDENGGGEATPPEMGSPRILTTPRPGDDVAPTRLEPGAYWLVMDMDGTVLSTPSKAGGHYLPLDQSPCHQPLRRWLERGGNLCVASTAGRRMWRQVYDVLKPVLKATGTPGAQKPGRLLVCGFSGAALFCTDDAGELVEDVSYRQHAVAGGTCPTVDQLNALIDVGTEMIRTFLVAAAKDDSLVAALSTKYHEPYRKLIAKMRDQGEEAFFRDYLTRDLMLRHGAVLKATNDALVDVQIVPGSEPLAAPQVTILGIPMRRFGDFFTPELVRALEDEGFHVKSQPNSVCIVREGVDKATIVRWLIQHAERYTGNTRGFSLRHAIAFGDNPDVVDRPLTTFPDMAFVSLAPKGQPVPSGQHIVHVGDEEIGCAKVLEALAPEAAEAEFPTCLDVFGEFSVTALSALAANLASTSAGQ